ncbi:hypothetical protein HY745_11680 [Candidatus Desantisbacteria bacterium]|nr:hypothetical protein [Candidatus Desantisbacteria bacterium]
MIVESIKNADDGVSINKEVMSNLEDINVQVNKVSEIMEEISTSSQQQNKGIDQINQAISQLNQLTQQNAANAEESASASEELSAQAQEMTSLVNSFEISLPDRIKSSGSVKKTAKHHFERMADAKKSNLISVDTMGQKNISKLNMEKIIPMGSDDQILKTF